MRVLAISCLIASFLATSASALTFQAEGTISISEVFQTAFEDEYQSSFSLTATLNPFTGVGIEQQANLQLTAFDPMVVGATTFDVTNTRVQVAYVEALAGGRLRVSVYGTQNTGVTAGVDDFRADFTIAGISPTEINRFSGTLPGDRFFVANAGVVGLGTASSNNSQLTASFAGSAVVPLPPAFVLMLSSLLCFAWVPQHRRKHHAAGPTVSV